MESICAWCGTVLRPAMQEDTRGGISHGICASCAGDPGVFPVYDLPSLSLEQFDRLPFGALELDAEGTVRRYNRAEERLSGLPRENVIGRSFFRDIAPCTDVAQFHGRYAALVRDGHGRDDFEFVFRFAEGARLVRIRMSYDGERERGTVLVAIVD